MFLIMAWTNGDSSNPQLSMVSLLCTDYSTTWTYVNFNIDYCTLLPYFDFNFKIFPCSQRAVYVKKSTMPPYQG